MLSRIRTEWKFFPATMSTITVALLLFLAVQIVQVVTGESHNEVLRQTGGVQTLFLFEDIDGEPRQIRLGAGDVWRGEIWRLLVSAFHHGSLFHLLSNCPILWFLGRLVESRAGKFGFLLFFLTGSALSIACELALGQPAVGLSGGIYALFGLLLLMRRSDDEIRAWMTETIVLLGLAWLVIGIFLARLEYMPIANVAHFSGFGYGLLAGVCWVVRRNSALRLVFVAAHGLLVPLVWLVVHPTYDARYNWYSARAAAREGNTDTAIRLLKKATQQEPGFEFAWVDLSARQFDSNPLTAWLTALHGLKANRNSRLLIRLCRSIWNELPSADARAEALDSLQGVFGDNSEDWLVALRLPMIQRLQSPFDMILHDPTFQPDWWHPGTTDRPPPDTSDEAINGTIL